MKNIPEKIECHPRELLTEYNIPSAKAAAKVFATGMAHSIRSPCTNIVCKSYLNPRFQAPDKSMDPETRKSRSDLCVGWSLPLEKTGEGFELDACQQSSRLHDGTRHIHGIHEMTVTKLQHRARINRTLTRFHLDFQTY